MTDLNVDLEDGQVDAAVWYGNGRYSRAGCERILEETVTPVCSPGYLYEVGGLPNLASLVRCTLLHEDRMLANWEQWLGLAGIERCRSARGPAYSHGSMAIEAAIRGEGVALGRSVVVHDEIAAGRLVAPFSDIRLKAKRGYDLVYRSGSGADAKVSVLRDWLAVEVRQFLLLPE